MRAGACNRLGLRVLGCAGLLAAALAVATTPPASALPAYGVNDLKSEGIAGGDADSLDWNGLADLSTMGSSGMGLYRARFRQDAVARGGWAQLDNLVRQASLRGVTVLPVLINMPGEAYTPPRSAAERAAFGAFAAEAARRYGPNGTLWAVCDCPALPISVWEVWNEQNVPAFWDQPDPVLYGQLLSATRAALRQADPAARILFGGLADLSGDRSERGIQPPEFLRQTIAVTGPAGFDAVALHTYNANPDGALQGLGETVAALVRFGGAGPGGAPRHQVWVDEFGHWTQADDVGTPVSDEEAASDGRQRSWLERMLAGLDQRRSAWNLGPTMWYAMRDVPTSLFHRIGVQRTGQDERLGLRRTNSDDTDAGAKPSWGIYSLAARNAAPVPMPPLLGATPSRAAPPSKRAAARKRRRAARRCKRRVRVTARGRVRRVSRRVRCKRPKRARKHRRSAAQLRRAR